MKKIILAILIIFILTGIAYAAGITFASEKIILSSGSSFVLASNNGTIQGFSTHPSGTCGANSTLYSQLLAQGATWQRTDNSLGWSSVQSTSSASYVWGPADCVVNDALALGINTIYLINLTPTWAKHPSCSTGNCAPINSTTLATFCTAVAQHFSGRITYFEVWNEPNLRTFWQPAATTTDYVSSLNACGTAIKAVIPNAKIIFGGLAPAATASGSIAITTFVTDAYAAGATFDIMGQHPYSYPWPLDKGSLDGSNNGWIAMENVRRIMNTNGDSSKKIWITEVGAPTCGPGTQLQLGQNGGATDYMSFEAQALIVQQIVSTTTISGVFNGNSYLNIEKIFWYTLVDRDSTDSSDPENCFGVYRTDGTKKPVFWVLKNT